jgi:hypothetical protein
VADEEGLQVTVEKVGSSVVKVPEVRDGGNDLPGGPSGGGAACPGCLAAFAAGQVTGDLKRPSRLSARL